MHMILQGDIKKFQHACELVGRPLRGSLMRNMAGQGLFDPRYFKRCRCTNGKVGDESNNRGRSLWYTIEHNCSAIEQICSIGGAKLKPFWLGSSFSSQEISYRKILGQLDDAGNTTTLAHYLRLLNNASLLCWFSAVLSRVLFAR